MPPKKKPETVNPNTINPPALCVLEITDLVGIHFDRHPNAGNPLGEVKLQQDTEWVDQHDRATITILVPEVHLKRLRYGAKYRLYLVEE